MTIKAKQIILVCCDRDGTVVKDENYYLGSADNWKEQIKFLPGVVEGIKKINHIPYSRFVITTNQSGVALSGERFEKLTERRMTEVNEEIVNRLKSKGARIDASFMCPYVDRAYVSKVERRGWLVLPEYVKDDAPCLKPRTGMLEEAAEYFNLSLAEIKNKFVVGDRASDVETGLNGNCITILVPSYKTAELDDVQKIRNLEKTHSGRIFIADNFYYAAEVIENCVGRAV
jgi:histidinol-phosphate phosphatase family protein